MRMLVAVIFGGALSAGCSAPRACWPPSPCPTTCPTPVPVAIASVTPAASPGGSDPYREAARHGQGGAAIWSFLSARYDGDRDGRIVPAEYPRDAKTFGRLDRSGDGVLASEDFAGPTEMESYIAEFVWRRLSAPPASQAPTPRPPGPLDRDAIAAAWRRVDRDGTEDGRVVASEIVAALHWAQATPAAGIPDFPRGVRPFPSLLAAQDADGSRDLSLDEVLAWVDRVAAEEAGAEKPAPDPKAMARRQGVAPGQEAPDFTLPLRSGDGSLTLSSFRGKQPVALVFGSYTCPPFRSAAPRLREIVQAWSDRVQFLFVYIREAHAVDGPSPMPSPDQPLVEEPVTDEERSRVASVCAADLGFVSFPTLVDAVDNAVGKAYAAAPVRLYVVGRDGKVVYRSRPGPFGLKPDEFEDGLREALAPSPAGEVSDPRVQAPARAGRRLLIPTDRGAKALPVVTMGE